jgi:hypothetical protein
MPRITIPVRNSLAYAVLEEQSKQEWHKFSIELRKRLIEVGYVDVLIGQLDVMGLDKKGSYTAQDLPQINRWPAIWAIVRKFCGSISCGNSHQCQFDYTNYSFEHQLALMSAPFASAFDVYRKEEGRSGFGGPSFRKK